MRINSTQDDDVTHTTLRTAPGFCTLRALTTWNTSTTPSVLHLSMVVAMAQNIPDLLTVSLHTHTHTHTVNTVSYILPTTHLQWTVMGRFPVLLWTFPISSTTPLTLLRLSQLLSGAQLVMRNWLTCWTLPDYAQHHVNTRERSSSTHYKSSV